jgi:hypothetical protein
MPNGGLLWDRSRVSQHRWRVGGQRLLGRFVFLCFCSLFVLFICFCFVFFVLFCSFIYLFYKDKTNTPFFFFFFLSFILGYLISVCLFRWWWRDVWQQRHATILHPWVYPGEIHGRDTQPCSTLEYALERYTEGWSSIEAPYAKNDYKQVFVKGSLVLNSLVDVTGLCLLCYLLL